MNPEDRLCEARKQIRIAREDIDHEFAEGLLACAVSHVRTATDEISDEEEVDR